MPRTPRPYLPNHISKKERIRSLVFAVFLLVYGIWGLIAGGICFAPDGENGLHLHGWPCWIMFAAFIAGAANLISVIVDHYDRRNNEIHYHMFAFYTRIAGICLFMTAWVVAGVQLNWIKNP